MTDRVLLSIMKACAEVGVSRGTIYNWLYAGKIEYTRSAGGAIRIYADTLWRGPVSRLKAAETNFSKVVSIPGSVEIRCVKFSGENKEFILDRPLVIKAGDQIEIRRGCLYINDVLRGKFKEV